MEREISIILKVKGAKAAKEAVQDVFNQQTTTLVKGFNQATKKTGDNMERIRRTSKQASTGMSSFTKTLGRGMAALYLYNRAWNLFGTQFEEGLQLQRASEQFESNVGNVTKMLPELRDATRGVISNFDLLRVAGRAVQQGLKKDQLSQTFRMAAVAAQKLNMSATDAISTMTQALTRQDEGALNSLGIITNVNQAYKTQAALIAKNGGVMSKAMGIQLRQSLIMRELQNRFGGANKAQEDGLMILERFKASWKNFRAEAGITLGHALIPLTRALTNVLDVITSLLKKLNETEGFKRFTQIAMTLAGVFAGFKFISGIRALMGLFSIGGTAATSTALANIAGSVGKISLKARGLLIVNSALAGMKTAMRVLMRFPTSMTGMLRLLNNMKDMFMSSRVALGELFATGFKFMKWSLWISVLMGALEPLGRILSKVWTGAKVLFQLLNNYDPETGLSKVLKSDAEALGGWFNRIENWAKNLIQLGAIFSGIGDAISEAFAPLTFLGRLIGQGLEFLADKLMLTDKSAIVAKSGLDRLKDTARELAKWLGLAASALIMLIPGGQLIGAAGVAAFGSSLLSEYGITQKVAGMVGGDSSAQTQPASQPQTSTQVSSPSVRPQNLDYSNDFGDLLRKTNKLLEGQTDIMETDSQKQEIKESQNNARNNVWMRR